MLHLLQILFLFCDAPRWSDEHSRELQKPQTIGVRLESPRGAPYRPRVPGDHLHALPCDPVDGQEPRHARPDAGHARVFLQRSSGGRDPGAGHAARLLGRVVEAQLEPVDAAHGGSEQTQVLVEAFPVVIEQLFEPDLFELCKTSDIQAIT